MLCYAMLCYGRYEATASVDEHVHLHLSARQLAELERRPIRQIVERGAAVRRQDTARAAGAAVDPPDRDPRQDAPLFTDEVEATQPVVPSGGRR